MGSSKVALAEPLLYFLSLIATRKKTRKRNGNEHAAWLVCFLIARM